MFWDPAEEKVINLVDTPGPLDFEGRDEEKMTNIQNFVIRKLWNVDYVLICLNGQQTRFDAGVQ